MRADRLFAAVRPMRCDLLGDDHRMAGGCTSGLVLSCGMQLAKSGLIFAAFAFISFILTGKLFYAAPQREPQT